MKYRDCGSCLPVAEMSLDFMIHTLCSMVWHERNLIIKMGLPNQLKDLHIEQCKLMSPMCVCVCQIVHYSMRLSGWCFTWLCSFFFLPFSFALWHSWICSIHWRKNGTRYCSMAGHWIRLLWVLWRWPTEWKRWCKHKKAKTKCCPFGRQLLRSYDRFGWSNIRSIC